jgi:hypothetical protein
MSAKAHERRAVGATIREPAESYNLERGRFRGLGHD